MENMRELTTDEEIKIFSDPYRMRILTTYKEAGKALTVKGVADLMGEVPAKIHYHVKKLLSIHILELDHMEIINGIQAKYYRLTTDNFRINYSENNPSSDQIIDKGTAVIINILDDFKKEVYEIAERVRNNPKPSENKNGGIFSKDRIYLSQEDFEDFGKEYMELFKKYEKSGSGKREYVILLSLLKKHPKGEISE